MDDHTDSPNETQEQFPTEQPEQRYVVYFIAQARSDYVKVGITSDIKNRLKQLQSGNPEQLIVLRLITTRSLENARAIESLIHQRYKSLQFAAHGEWFSLNPTRLIHDLNFAIEFGLLLDQAIDIIDAPRDDPYPEVSRWVPGFDDKPLLSDWKYIGYPNGSEVENFLYDALNKPSPEDADADTSGGDDD